MLVIGGLILSFLPRAPHIALNPDIVFLVVLPPLLFSAACITSWPEFRYNLVSISMLAFGLVFFTVRGVASISHWILPGFDFRLGLVLGAVVCTTDAIAVTSIAERFGLPKRITAVIEGESLVNDASGLLALQYASALLVSGYTPTLAESAGRLIFLVASAIVIGFLVGKLIYYTISIIDEPSIEVTISLIAPYFAYLLAQSVRSSGVLATIICGFYLGHQSSLYLSSGARLKGYAVWDMLTFILNGFVFILIGLQLPYVLEGIHEYSRGSLIGFGLLISLVVMLLRMIWVYPGAWVSNFIRRRLLHQPEPFPNPRAVLVIGWTGMRGVVALAAAISLPETLKDGSPFPQRNLIIFVTFCVIFVTLVVQGLTLAPLIRLLGLAGSDGENIEEAQARRGLIEAAVAYLETARESDRPEFLPVYDELLRLQERRLRRFEEAELRGADYRPAQYDRYLALSRKIRALQRGALLNLRNHNQIGDETMRKLEYELDLVEAQYSTT